jgi:hypothetical protein
MGLGGPTSDDLDLDMCCRGHRSERRLKGFDRRSLFVGKILTK